MKKRIALVAFVAACTLLLASCANNAQQYEVVTVPTQNVNLSPANVPLDDEEPDYDPLDEEEDYLEVGDEITIPQQLGQDSLQPMVNAPTAPPVIRSEYAGATPILINPIDMPSPTPVPPLTFTYQTYDATKLHLSFEAPSGWVVDDTANDTYKLTNPAPGFDYAADVRLTMVGVSHDYNKEEMKKEVKQYLDNIKPTYSSFSPSNTAERTFLDKTGIYANFKATDANGVKLAGRVHVTCVDRKLYTVVCTYPQAYTETYVDNVYAHIRKTVVMK